jgi:hypothetical protein
MPTISPELEPSTEHELTASAGSESARRLRIVHPELSHGKVQLIEPSQRGYLYLAASVRPGAAPIVLPSAQRAKLTNQVKQLTALLTRLDGVVHANTFRAIVLPPTARFSHYLKERGAAERVADYDLMVLVQTTSVAAAHHIRGSAELERLEKALRNDARHVQVTVARNAKRIGDVSLDRDGLFLFNHFAAADPAVMLELWDYLAAWYVAETGLSNSIALVPETHRPAEYALVNWARWEMSPLHHFWSQLSKASFWRYVTANLDANRAASMPIYCRLA